MKSRCVELCIWSSATVMAIEIIQLQKITSERQPLRTSKHGGQILTDVAAEPQANERSYVLAIGSDW